MANEVQYQPVPARGGALSAGYADREETSGNIRHVFSALRRFKWLLAGGAVVGAALGVLASRFVTPEYSVQATVFVESPPSDNGPLRADGLLEGNSSWSALLLSYAVLDSVILKERLFIGEDRLADSAVTRLLDVAPGYIPGAYQLIVSEAGTRWELHNTSAKTVVDRGVAGDSIGRPVKLLWQPPKSALANDGTIAFRVYTSREASALLQQRLGTQMGDNGNFLRITLRDTDPLRATRTMNTLIEQFVTLAADLKSFRLREQAKVLREQLATTEGQLRGAETRLENFKTKIITLPSESAPIAAGLSSTSPTVMTQFFGQKVELETVRREREQLEGLLAADVVDPASIALMPSARTSTDMMKALEELATEEANLRALRSRYTDESRLVQVSQQKVETLRRQTIPGYVRAVVRGLQGRERDLGGRIATASRDLQEIPTRAINEQRLLREVASLADIYADIQRRYQAARLAEASAIPDLRVLDKAVTPSIPSKNSKPQVIAVALVLGLGLAGGLAFLMMMLDRRVRFPEQVTQDLGLPILGAIPPIIRKKRGIVDEDSETQILEAFRSIRLALTHAYGTSGPVIFTVSSPGPGDGKSLVSSNLAYAFAQSGFQTLLIDGDIRRGHLHRLLGLRRQPGLTDYLAGTATRDAVLTPTTYKNLMVIPCGTRLARGPELLGSPQMLELIAEAKNRFQVIVVDSPPLGAAVDPLALATITGNLLLVLRAGESDRRVAEARLKVLDRLPVRLLGAVLNDAKAQDFADYYGYGYGYEVEPENSPGLLADVAAGGDRA